MSLKYPTPGQRKARKQEARSKEVRRRRLLMEIHSWNYPCPLVSSYRLNGPSKVRWDTRKGQPVSCPDCKARMVEHVLENDLDEGVRLRWEGTDASATFVRWPAPPAPRNLWWKKS